MNQNQADEAVTKIVMQGEKSLSKAKLKRLSDKAEVERTWRVLPPGSSWTRRNGQTAHAGPRYGAPKVGSPLDDEETDPDGSV